MPRRNVTPCLSELVVGSFLLRPTAFTMTKEDWTLVTDRSQKKRIQNRVAQRTYRNRIKQRVEELEKEVSEYRRREQEAEGIKDGEASANGSSVAMQSSATDIRRSPGRDKENPAGPSRSNCTATSRDQSTSNNSDKSNDRASSSNSSYILDMEMADGDARPSDMGTMLQPGGSAIQSQCLAQPGHPRSQMPPQVAFASFPGFASPPLSQPYSLSPDWGWSNVASNMYRETLHQQSLPAFTGIGAGRQSSTCNGNAAGSDASYQLSSETSYLVRPGVQEHSHIPTPDGTMDIPTTTADRSSDGGSIGAPSPASSGSVSSTTPQRNYNNTITVDPSLRDRPLEERFEHLRQCMESLGLGSLEDSMGRYYTEDFDHDSDISQDQRNSRHSELPLLLAKLRTNAKGWSQWEAHGYQYEIIKSAETIARSERAECAASRTAFADVLVEIEKLPTETDGLDNSSLSKAFRPLTKLFQDKVPKLWALTESLVGCDESANQRQRRYTSLAIMLLLCCSGQVRKPQMTALIGSCMEIAYGSQA
ncbi:hypothetical protein JDV02_002881 [Purpureocillium takamizusanense]|uniref:BZIP domain-containing protein n=1 Tax=Purpureocillium takamizusanense TaxID=2060973 RepID=A0A9Q8Q9J5_9HYPO|nr:uncharacterized protein JDV02_002881 [Purpureocillium takamizusanense]UNI16449.1 hypothetical protein JDV02_002881 [Purpureocillium takamizusanense]